MGLFSSSSSSKSSSTSNDNDTTKDNSSIVEDQGINLTDGSQLGQVNNKFDIRASGKKSSINGNTFITQSLDADTVSRAFDFGDSALDFANANNRLANDVTLRSLDFVEQTQGNIGSTIQAATIGTAQALSSVTESLLADKADARETADTEIISIIGKYSTLIILGSAAAYYFSKKKA